MRYARLLLMQLRASMLLALQYRADFLLDGFVEVFWMVPAIVPLAVVFRVRPSLGTWTFGEALMVVGWFTFLQGVLEGVINPSLVTVVDHIRKGTLDFVLLKPADAQFLVSTARFQPWRSTNVLTALAIWTVAFIRLGRGPSPVGALAALVLLGSATLLLYSLWILTISAAFYVVKVDNLTNLFSSVFDAARWPVQIFRGVLRWVFTLVVPLALMTTYPAEALLGRLSPLALAGSVAGAVAFAWLSRRVWLGSLARYSSASS